MGDTKSTYKAVIYADPPSIKTEVVDLPIPEPGVGEVLVRLYVHTLRYSFLPFPYTYFPWTQGVGDGYRVALVYVLEGPVW